jgi:hypothetical protein
VYRAGEEADAGRGRRAGRGAALWEITFVVGCVLVAEWAILPLFGRDLVAGLIPVGVALVFMFVSHRARGEGRRDLGLRADNFWPALRLLALPTLLACGLLAAVGYWMGSLRADRLRGGWFVAANLVWLFAWGLIQQYALQAFFNRRAQVVWGPGARSIFATAAIFGLLHMPNVWLAAATFAGGLVWSAVYQRAPNLFALGLSHCLMTVVLVSTLPASALHGMRVGYGYYLRTEKQERQEPETPSATSGASPSSARTEPVWSAFRPRPSSSS